MDRQWPACHTGLISWKYHHHAISRQGASIHVPGHTSHTERGDVARYSFTAAHARTIFKSQGQNLKHLLVCLDCPIVPACLAYVALSRVCRKADLSVTQPMLANQLWPVNTWKPVISLLFGGLLCFLTKLAAIKFAADTNNSNIPLNLAEVTVVHLLQRSVRETLSFKHST